MRLYDIASGIEQLINQGFVFDEETGEILLETDDLDAAQINFNDKLENCALFVKNLKAEAEAIKAEEKRLKERRESLDRKADRLSDYMLYCMKMAGVTKQETAKAAISIRKSKRVVIEAAEAIPDQYCNVKTDITPDKNKIKKALQAGETIKGARLVEGENLGIK